jgi:hypothetical protein
LNATELREALAALSLNQTTGARALGVAPRTMRHYCGGRAAIPELMCRVIRASLVNRGILDAVIANASAPPMPDEA